MARLLLTGYPGWLTTRFFETLGDYPQKFDKIRVLSLLKNSSTSFFAGKIELVTGNLLDAVVMDEACRDVDVILHAAGVLHVKKISDFYRINTQGTEQLLNAAVKNKVKRFVYISTNAAQGFCRGRGHELKESDPCHPKSHYGHSKYQAELAVEQASLKHAIETVILRPAMFYGPPVAERHLEIYRMVRDGRFPLFGDGNYLRSITYIDNLIQGIHLALSHPKAVGQTYYLTDKEIPTLLEILQAMADNLNVSLRVRKYPKFLAKGAEIFDNVISSLGFYWMMPHIVGESCRNIACQITKAEQEIGYAPAVSYKEGYQRTIAWCRERKLV